MTAIFAKVLPFLKDAEGITDETNPNDYGGETKFGISKASNPDIDISKLDWDGACKFYEERYWIPFRLGEIIDQTIATQMFLLLINMDPHKAIVIVQTAVNSCGRTITEIALDGLIGSVTIAAINSLNRFWLSDRIRVEAVRFYWKRTNEDRTQISNLRSWIRRSLL